MVINECHFYIFKLRYNKKNFNTSPFLASVHSLTLVFHFIITPYNKFGAFTV